MMGDGINATLVYNKWVALDFFLLFLLEGFQKMGLLHNQWFKFFN